MQVPAELREATERALEGVSRKTLSERASRMSELYRSGGGSATAIRDELDAMAYAISRLPATFAAARNALDRLRERSPEFQPRSVLDLGAGPGTASWAAIDAWPQIESITQVDANANLLSLGARLAESASSNGLRNAHRVAADITQESGPDSQAELVVLSYTLVELGTAQMERLLASAWRRCLGALVIVEPGTPAGYRRILLLRDLLVKQRASILAPCPHQLNCPLLAGDWCHFAQRVARSRDHKILKAAEAPYEDEKFSYLIAVREALFQPASASRILARPQIDHHSFTAKVCRPDGTAERLTVLKRYKDVFRRARRKDWGDQIEPKGSEIERW